MLTKCSNCGFYVSNFERKCLNCGRSISLRKISENYLQISKIPACFSLFFALLSSYSVTMFLHGGIEVPFLIISFLTFFLFLFSVLFTIEFKKNRNVTKEETIKPLSTLNGKQSLIESRIAELSKRAQRLDTVLDKIRLDDGLELQNVRQKLLSARQVIIGQFARYELQKQKIELIRLQNSVSPYLFKLHRLNDFETENGLAAIEQTKMEINRIRQSLTGFAAIDFPPNTQSEKESFLSQLNETQVSCQKLREALLSKQATRALQDISPVEKSLQTPIHKELARESAIFNIQTSLTDISESFEELEREYQRLQIETELNESLSTSEN